MSSTSIFDPPQPVIDRIEELRDLILNKGQDGTLPAVHLAKYLRRDVDWVRRTICNGGTPFAFGDASSSRLLSYIGIAPLWCFETQLNTTLLRNEGQKTH